MQRCGWTRDKDFYNEHHDREWGVPLHDDRKLLEFLILEGAQAGLSWETILRKRENFRRAFDHLDARRIARYDERKIQSLLADMGKITSQAVFDTRKSVDAETEHRRACAVDGSLARRNHRVAPSRTHRSG